MLHGGFAQGPLIGGNLAVLHALAAGGRLSVPRGSVLALEDVAELPYRIDCMLTSLVLGGHLANVSALVFGAFDRCRVEGADGPTIGEVLEERTRSLGIPVLFGAPFGHGDVNDAFVLGQPAAVGDGDIRLGVPAESAPPVN